MKINPQQLHQHIQELHADEPAVRWRAVCCLGKFSKEEWDNTPEIVDVAVEAPIAPDLIKTREASNPPFRIEVARILSNLGARSRSVVSELVSWLTEERDNGVRRETIRALGKIGPPAKSRRENARQGVAATGWRPGTP